jgi:3-methyladenine DNA glycosylase/8-oxoguanine DNA glycosylase
MPRGPQGQKRPADAIGCAIMVGRIATGEIIEELKEPSGKVRSGKAGSKARAEKLSQEERTAIARKAAAAFGADVDYAQLVKLYGPSSDSSKGRYSPAECNGIKKTPIEGKPDPQHISTSFVERQNLSMRMGMRRFTRLTNAFSKKLENHVHALALYFVHYNWMRIHKTLRVTPAMAAGLTGKLMGWEDIIAIMDAEGENALAKKRAAMLGELPYSN